jgi:hypothetical protein
MALIAYVDKAPEFLRSEIRAQFLPGRRKHIGVPVVRIPLLNTLETGYSTEVEEQGRIRPLVDVPLEIPKTRPPATEAATLCDDSMERERGASFPRGCIVLLRHLKRLVSGAVVYVVHGKAGENAAALGVLSLCAGKPITLRPFNPGHPGRVLIRARVLAACKIVGKIEMFRRTNLP